MKLQLLVLCTALSLSLAACKGDKPVGLSDEPAAETGEPENSPDQASEATPASPGAAVATEAEPSEADAARAEQQAKLDYASMEDGYINDGKGQWAASARASSSFGNANDESADSRSSNTPWHATGAPNGKSWSNGNQDIGFDWLELAYAAPMQATEVRIVTPSGEAAAAITKLELIDPEGNPHTVWSGLSDTRKDDRGSRTWIVRKFDATPYAVKALKVSFANNVASGYKEVDAVQLIGQ